MNKNRRASLQPQKKHLSHDLLQQYLFGKLPERTRHQVERHLLDCDFCSEAADGLSGFSDDKQIARNVDELKERLHKRVNRRRFILPFGIQPYAIAASIILLVTCVAVVWLSTHQATSSGGKAVIPTVDSTSVNLADSLYSDTPGTNKRISSPTDTAPTLPDTPSNQP
jgi:hypothetical protein